MRTLERLKYVPSIFRASDKIQTFSSRNQTIYVGRVLLQYKRISLRSLLRPSHTNEKEILSWIKVFTNLGYDVDLIDRNNVDFSPRRSYTAFFGLGTSGSSNNTLRTFDRCKSDKLFLICTTPKPSVANQIRRNHLQKFESKFGILPKITRLDPSESYWNDLSGRADGLFVYGFQGNGWPNSTYSQQSLPVYSFGPTALEYAPKSVIRNRLPAHREFICLSGHGMIAKGVDLVIEAFLDLPEAQLTIFGPKDESVLRAYGDLISKRSNIKLLPFQQITSGKLAQFSKKYIASVSASPSESSATSVATLMTAGIFPIHTTETGYPAFFGYSLGEFGDGTKEAIVTAVKEILSESDETLLLKRQDSIAKANMFSHKVFESSLSESISAALPFE